MKLEGRRISLDGTWPHALAALVCVLALFEFTSLDLWVQDFFYDFRTHAWIVDAREFWGRLFFYTGPKVVLVIAGVAALVLAFGRTRWRKALSRPPVRRRDLLVFVAVLATGPALIALGKATTNIYFPSQITRYGGKVAYVKLFERFAPGDRPAKPGEGFPAGHASGGFALLALAGLGRARRWRTRGVWIGMAAGSLMGGYQMLKGAHYLSHTLVTALVCWLLFLLWRRVFGAHDGYSGALVEESGREPEDEQKFMRDSPVVHSPLLTSKT